MNFPTFCSNIFLTRNINFYVNDLFNNEDDGWYYTADSSRIMNTSGETVKNGEEIDVIGDQIRNNIGNAYNISPIFVENQENNYISFQGGDFIINNCEFITPTTLAFVINADDYYNSAYGAMTIGGIGAYYGAGTGYGVSLTNNGDKLHTQLRREQTVSQSYSMTGTFTGKKLLIIAVYSYNYVSLYVNDYGPFIDEHSLGNLVPNNKFCIGGLYSNSSTARFNGKLYCSLGINKELNLNEIDLLKDHLFNKYNI